MKLIVIVFLIGVIVSLLIFILICVGVILYFKVVFFIISILGGLFVNGIILLFFELVVEFIYFVVEGIILGFLIFFNNFL